MASSLAPARISRLFVLALALGGLTAHAAALPSRIEGRDVRTDHPFTLKLGQAKGHGPAKPTVVLFLSSRCPCSKSHEDALSQLATDFAGDANFVAVLSNIDETVAEASAHFREKAATFPVILDRKLALADAFGATNTPQAFVVAADGKSVLYHGGISDAHKLVPNAKSFYLRDILQDLREGKPARVAENKTLGCYIKRVPDPK